MFLIGFVCPIDFVVFKEILVNFFVFKKVFLIVIIKERLLIS